MAFFKKNSFLIVILTNNSVDQKIDNHVGTERNSCAEKVKFLRFLPNSNIKNAFEVLTNVSKHWCELLFLADSHLEGQKYGLKLRCTSAVETK